MTITRAEQFLPLIKTEKEITLLDVRTPEETASGVLKGAVAVDVLDLDFRSHIETLNKEDTYLVYCQIGERAKRAAEIMEAEGFTNLYALVANFDAIVANYPTTTEFVRKG